MEGINGVFAWAKPTFLVVKSLLNFLSHSKTFRFSEARVWKSNVPLYLQDFLRLQGKRLNFLRRPLHTYYFWIHIGQRLGLIKYELQSNLALVNFSRNTKSLLLPVVYYTANVKLYNWEQNKPLVCTFHYVNEVTLRGQKLPLKCY